MRWLRVFFLSILCYGTSTSAFSHGMMVRVRTHAVATTMSNRNHTETAKGNNMNVGHIIGDCYRKGVKNHNKHCGCMIVKLVSSFLPYADTIGHTVLHANNDFITYIMNMDEKKISHKTKGRIILLSIRLAQWGDNVGGHVLQMYHDLVQKCFDDAD